MIKKILKSIAYKIYLLGKIEQDRIDKERWLSHLSSNASIASDALISHEVSIVNHQERPENISIGSNSWIRGELLLFKHGGKISIGRDCFIGQGSRIWSAESIYIGNHVLISHNVNIHDNNSHPFDFMKRRADYQFIKKTGTVQSQLEIEQKPIVIEDDVWIGFNSVILKGVTIGKGSIIGAGSIISKDIPPFSVVVGSPQKIIKHI